MIGLVPDEIWKASPLSSRGAAFAVACAHELHMKELCSGLAAELEACGNDDALETLNGIIEHQEGRLLEINREAELAGVDVSLSGLEEWMAFPLEQGRAHAFADNPYLMTPYRVHCFAVAVKERIFESLTNLASVEQDELLVHILEALARETLTEIAHSRLARRQAFRSKLKSAIEQMGQVRPPANMKAFDEAAACVRTVLCGLFEERIGFLETEISEETKQALLAISAEINSEGDDQDAAATAIEFKPPSQTEPDDVVGSLKSLLRETEAATDLFLSYSETSATEDIMRAALATAETYVRLIPAIRREIDRTLAEG